MSVVACTCPAAPAPIDVAGVPIHPLSPSETLQRLQQTLDCEEAHVLNHLSVDPIVASRDRADLEEALSRATLNVPDGMGVVWGARALGAKHLRRRVYGPEFLLTAAVTGTERGIRHAFVGGTPDSIVRLTDRLRSIVTGIDIAAAHSPPMREVTPEAVEEDIAALGTTSDILWVGLGTPKQQLWADLARAHRPAKVIATVGAAFDFLAGDKRQAPAWMQDRGLEWAFRLATEPRRLWKRYLVGNPRFVGAVVKQRLGR